MPYIEESDRKKVLPEHRDMFSDQLAGKHYIEIENIETPGEMNYAITEMIINYLDRKGVSYTNMNEVVGVLECAKLELYRRMTAPYEDEKIEANGDVY